MGNHLSIYLIITKRNFLSESFRHAGPQHSKIISCHIVRHHTANLNETLNIENVDFNLCTHLIYFIASLKENGKNDNFGQQI